MTVSSSAAPDAGGEAEAPTIWAARRELRAPFELGWSMMHSRSLAGWPRGDGHPVVVVPGFLAGAESTGYLRKHLRRLGYRALDWGQGRNRDISSERTAALADMLTALHSRYGRPCSVIGWSAGGIHAREMGRLVPEHTRMVITLACPFKEHLPDTPAWRAYQLVNRKVPHEELFTEEAIAQRAAPLPVPTTHVYSRSDGIVAWRSCVSSPAPRTENVEVHSTHFGMAVNIECLRVIADRLAQPEGAWSPYAAAG